MGFITSIAKLIVKKFQSPTDENYNKSVDWVEKCIKEVLVSADGRMYQLLYDKEIFKVDKKWLEPR